MADLRQSPQFAKYLKALGWIVEKCIFIRPLWIFGALAKIQRGILPPNYKEILKKHRVWYFEQNHSPSKTLRVDLTPSKPKILSQFKKDARYILRKLSTQHLALSTNNYQLFYEIWEKSAKRKSLWIPKEKEYFNLIKCFKNKL